MKILNAQKLSLCMRCPNLDIVHQWIKLLQLGHHGKLESWEAVSSDAAYAMISFWNYLFHWQSTTFDSYDNSNDAHPTNIFKTKDHAKIGIITPGMSTSAAVVGQH